MEGGNDEASRKQAVRFWRAWRTVHEMCQDRGYELSDEEVKITFDEFEANFADETGRTINPAKLQFSARPTDAMMTKYTDPNNPDIPDVGSLYVEFIIQADTLGVKEIKKFVQHCSANHYRAGIMVTSSALSAQARKALSGVEKYTRIECFLMDELLVNITHHDLVPMHVVLSREEKAALLKRYRLRETQLPRMLLKDPVARYFGLKKGEVVKIIRASETAGRYASYRLCV